MNKEDGISHIAYFRTDGGSSILYTEEYVNELKQALLNIKEYIDNQLGHSWDREYRPDIDQNDLDKIIDIVNKAIGGE